MHPRFIWLATVIATCFSTIANGEPVNLVSNVQGQAFTFSYRGQCYAIMPNHVSRRGFFSLTGGNPERQGNGEMTQLRFKETDLALAVVKGPLANKCEPDWLDLPTDLGRKLPLGGNATLITIRSNGVKENTPVKMVSITYEHIYVIPSKFSEQDAIVQGKSGSILAVDNQPVGILVGSSTASKNSVTAAKVLRMDAIVARLNRYILGRRALTDEKITIPKNTENLEFEVKKWNVTPLHPENNPTNLASYSGVPFLTKPLRKLLKIELELAGEKLPPVREVIIESDVSDGQTTAPKSIGILASNRSDGTRLRTIATGEMSPDGRFEIKLPPQHMRWLIIHVKSVWDPTKRLRLDKIIVR